jgi:hypothetical protein
MDQWIQTLIDNGFVYDKKYDGMTKYPHVVFRGGNEEYEVMQVMNGTEYTNHRGHTTAPKLDFITKVNTIEELKAITG